LLNLNYKKKKINNFLLTGGLLLIILAALFPLTCIYSYSMENKYSFWHRDIKNFSEDISNYTVGVESSLRIYMWGPNYEVTGDYNKIVGYFFHYYLDLAPFSSEGINITGILFYTYERLLGGVSESNYSRTVDHASLIEEDGKIKNISLSTRFAIQGSVEIEYISNATHFTEEIDFNLNIVPPEDPEHKQAISLARSLFFWHIASFIIIPVLFAFINHRLKKQPQTTSRDEEFRRILREKNKLLREKNGEE